MITRGKQYNEMMECLFMTLAKEDIDWANYSPMPLGALGPRGFAVSSLTTSPLFWVHFIIYKPQLSFNPMDL